MTRSVLQPIRNRRIARPIQPASDGRAKTAKLSPATRKTLAAIGALWVSFAVNASATPSQTKITEPAPATGRNDAFALRLESQNGGPENWRALTSTRSIAPTYSGPAPAGPLHLNCAGLREEAGNLNPPSK